MVARTTPATDVGYDNVVQCLRKRITFTNTTALAIGTLPPNASILGGGAHVVTAFNAGTTNDVNVGHTGDADALATLLAVGTLGFKALDELAAATNAISTSERVITATYVPTGTAATAGVAEVEILFVAPTGNP